MILYLKIHYYDYYSPSCIIEFRQKKKTCIIE